MLMLSTFGREYGKLCEIESAIDFRFYEANYTSLAEFFKSLSYLVWSSLVVDTGSRQWVLSGRNIDCFNHVNHHKGYGAL